MKWDWAIDSFKALIVAGVTWSVVHLRKKAKPFLTSIGKHRKAPEDIEDLKKRIAILEVDKQAMWDILRDPIFITDEDGDVIYVNNAFAKMAGVSDPKDLHGRGFMKLIPKDDKEYIQEMGETIREHPSNFEDVVRYINQQNLSIVSAEVRTALRYSADGTYKGSLGRLYIIKTEPPK